MNRRGFLKFVGAGAVAAAVAPSLLAVPPTCSLSDRDYYRAKQEEAGPGGWVSYRYRYTVTLPPPANMRFRDHRGLMCVPRLRPIQ